jgi:phosphatidate cytidylyltransferase
MFRQRLISGIILVLVAIAVIVPGNEVLLAAMCIISWVGLFELYRVFGMEKSILAVCGYVAAGLYYVNLQFQVVSDLIGGAIAFLIVLMAVYVFTYPKYHTQQIVGAFFGVFYVAVMLSYIYRTRQLPMEMGAYLVWLIFLSAWGSDTCAYCVGMLIGKHKMTPRLSPKKSVEGAIGGVVGAALLGFLYAYIFHAQLGAKMPPYVALLCAAGALISMVGDLAASAIKRNYEIKDYGTLIPGHGGILDRFDSVIFTAPVVFYLAQYLVNGIQSVS